MLEKFYKASITIVVSLIFFTFFTRSWSIICSKIAVRFCYGSKSSWDKIYIVADQQINDDIMGLITDISYDIVDEPTTISYISPYECVLNKCNPDVIISRDISFFEANRINYPLGKFDFGTVNFVGMTDLTINNTHNIIGLDFWENHMLFGIPKKTKHKFFASLLIKRITRDKLFHRKVLVEERMRQIERAKQAKNKKTTQMKEKTLSRRLEGRLEKTVSDK